LPRKATDARQKNYHHAIVVGEREAEKGSVSIKILHTHNKDRVKEVLRSFLNKEATDFELNNKGVDMPLDVARKYFEALANAYL
jgi:threonyl-tRNA synthetase